MTMSQPNIPQGIERAIGGPSGVRLSHKIVGIGSLTVLASIGVPFLAPIGAGLVAGGTLMELANQAVGSHQSGPTMSLPR